MLIKAAIDRAALPAEGGTRFSLSRCFFPVHMAGPAAVVDSDFTNI